MEKLKVLFEIFVDGISDLYYWYHNNVDDDMTLLVISSVIGSILLIFGHIYIMIFLLLFVILFIFRFNFREIPLIGLGFVLNFLMVVVLTLAFENIIFDADNLVSTTSKHLKNPKAVMTKDKYYLVSGNESVEIDEKQYVLLKANSCNDILYTKKVFNNKDYVLVSEDKQETFKCVDKE